MHTAKCMSLMLNSSANSMAAHVTPLDTNTGMAHLRTQTSEGFTRLQRWVQLCPCAGTSQCWHFNWHILHHLLYQSTSNIHNSYFSKFYVYLLNFHALAELLLMAKGVALVAGLAEIMRTLLLVALKQDFSALAESEHPLFCAQRKKRVHKLAARMFSTTHLIERINVIVFISLTSIDNC